METIDVPLDELNPSQYNPRVMPEKMMQRLGKGMREFGVVEPLVVNKRTGTVVGGHQRLEAARRAGLMTLMKHGRPVEAEPV